MRRGRDRKKEREKRQERREKKHKEGKRETGEDQKQGGSERKEWCTETIRHKGVLSLPLFASFQLPHTRAHARTCTCTESNLYSLNPEMPDWLWQNSEVSSCLTLVYHQTLSPSSLTHTHIHTGRQALPPPHTRMHFSFLSSCHPPATSTGEKHYSALGNKLIHVLGIDSGSSQKASDSVDALLPRGFYENLVLEVEL